MPPKIHLEKPTLARANSYFEMVEEMRASGEVIWEGFLPRLGEPVGEFVERIAIKAESDPELGLVRESIFWAIFEGHVVGRIGLRHRLNKNLEEFGGHIGYEVRPSARRQGIAREMLRQVLSLPKAKEIGRLLLTTAPSNLASIKTIIANGGVFEKTQYVTRVKRETSYYWITLSNL